MTETSLNGTAVSVCTNTPTMGRWPGYKPVAEVDRRRPIVVSSFLVAEQELKDFVRASNAGITRSSVRVPLDVQRGACIGPKWRGLSLEEFTTSSHGDLVKCYKLLMDIQVHTGHVMPVLVDENLLQISEVDVFRIVQPSGNT